ncbi:YlzJ-like family protein [Paenibacillus thailandensis]|uniref:YlzJ-like family protein n=1 Tax=Paenibacillus thailandensis TaxID=393250 RepID=A0ABW5QXA5_9BACL
MTIYTSMPLEVVLDGIHNDKRSFHEIWVGGIHMQVEPVAPGVGRIVRLLQCDLEHYLNPMLAPGTIVHYGAGNAPGEPRKDTE